MFILTITKFEHDDNDIPTKKLIPKKKKALGIKRKSPILTTSKSIYSFDSFDAFCDFCNVLNKSTYSDKLSKFAKKSCLYEYLSNYYLIFTDINLDLDISRFVCPVISEFAHFVDNSELFERKIVEYGSPIIKKDAITTCISYFS